MHKGFLIFDRLFNFTLDLKEPRDHDARMNGNGPFLKGKRRMRFEALTRVLVPRSAAFTSPQWDEACTLVDGVLQDKPASVHRKLGLFMWLMDLVSVMLAGKTVRHLPPENQRRVMDWFFNSPISLFRKGFWGINTLCKLAVYGQPQIQDEIGYVKKSVMQAGDAA